MTVTEEIISRLDVLAEYGAWGVQFERDEPNAGGWVSCWAVDRERGDKPSAAINVRSGRYKDKGGKGESLSLFEFAAKYGGLGDKDAAFAHFREKSGVTGAGKNRRPDSRLEFLEWSPLLVDTWAAFFKPGVTAEAVEAFGGRLARYRDAFVVVALPIWSAALNEPIGWTIWNTSGGPLPSWPKKGQKEPTWVKMKTTAGSGNGLFCDPASIATAKTICKCEGPADALALWAATPAGERTQFTAVANSSGAGEPPQEPIVKLFAGKAGLVVGDCDVPGQEGAKTWAGAIARHAETVRTIALPYEIVSNHGRDLRDYLTGGYGFEDLIALAPKAEAVAAATLKSFDKPDDPHRLAEAFLTSRYWDPKQSLRTLRYYRAQWSRYRNGGYSQVSEVEIVGELTRFLRDLFVEINLAELQANIGETTPETRRVTRTLTGDVLHAMKGECLVSGEHELPTWLDGPELVPAKEIFACRNGLLYPKAYIESPDADYFFPATPRFFSMNVAPYDYRRTLGKPKLWLEFLHSIWGDDWEQIKALQQWFGYCLLPDTSQHKMFLLIGPPRAGKGVIQDVLTELLGKSNVVATSLGKLTGQFGLQPLQGKSLVKLGDARLSGRDDITHIVETVLGITGGDEQSIDRKFLESISTKLYCRFFLASNEFPALKDASAALLSRLVLCRLTKSFKGSEDFGLTARILTELPEILQWALEGLASLKREGRFVTPRSSQNMLDEAARGISPVGFFVEECCTLDPACRIESEVLFEKWKEFSAQEGRRDPGTHAWFARDLMARYPQVQKERVRVLGQRVHYYTGIGLGRSDGPEDAEQRAQQAQKRFDGL